MPTLLVTNKMAPELARRVQESVSGRRRVPGHKSRSPSTVALLRVTTVVLVVLGIGGAFVFRQRERDDLERVREGVLASVAKAASSLTPDDRQTLPRAEGTLMHAARAYDGDVLDPALASKTKLAELLEKPLIYVRGEIDAFGTPSKIAETARASQKDAFLLCLLDPPATRSERALLERVYVAYSSRNGLEDRTPNARPLYEAEAGAPFFAPEFVERVRGVDDRRRLLELERSLERAPLEQARAAAKARTLVFVMDEPGAPGTIAELDGERARHVRVGIVDLATEKVLLRLRRFVDPAWISLKRRAEYASGLDACALSLDVRAALLREPAPVWSAAPAASLAAPAASTRL
jgi:hypothetical protein